MFLSCLKAWDLKASTEDAQSNGVNFRSRCVFAHAITFSFSVHSHGSSNTIQLQLSGLARRNALSALCSPPVLSSPPSSETPPPERLARPQWEVVLWKDDVLSWGAVRTCACFALAQISWWVVFLFCFFPVRFHSHVIVFSVCVCVVSVPTNTQDCHYLPSLSNVLKVYQKWYIFFRKKVNTEHNEGYLHRLIRPVLSLERVGGFIQWDAGWTVCSLARRLELTLCTVSLQHNTHEFKWICCFPSLLSFFHISPSTLTFFHFPFSTFLYIQFYLFLCFWLGSFMKILNLR